MRRKLATLVVAAAVAEALPMLPTTASAAPFPDDPYYICVGDCAVARTDGRITWGQRTANVTGEVVDVGVGSTTATFKAYAGATQIGATQTRTSSEGAKGYGFTMGDPNLRGGINKITIQLCTSAGPHCSGVFSYTR